MANTLLPVEEQNLTPNQVEQLDKRRNRGFTADGDLRPIRHHQYDIAAAGWSRI